MERENWPDILKGLAIILVVLGHSLKHFDNDGMHQLCDIIYLFHMPLFILLSGYTFRWIVKHNSYSRNIFNNVCIYVIQSLVYICFNICVQNIVVTSNHYSARDLLTFPVIPVAHFWYIQALIIYHLIFWAIEKLVGNIRIRRILEIVTVIFIFMLHRHLPGEVLTRICYHFIFFGAGYFIHMISDKITHTEHSELIPGLREIAFLGFNSLWIYIFHPYATAGIKLLLHILHIDNPYVGLSVMLTGAITLPLLLRILMIRTHTAWIVTSPGNVSIGKLIKRKKADS